MGKKLLTICALVLLTAGSASAAITVYDQDRPGWETAVGAYDEEFFVDATLNPGVTVVTDNGYVTGGVWWDQLVVYPATTTTWSFAAPITGYGANWDPGIPGGPGTNIEVAINGSWVVVGEIPSTYTGDFWGFVSDDTFTDVRLAAGSLTGAWAETYEMDNMVYSSQAAVPEASTLLLFGPGALGLLGYYRRRLFRKA